ncbi:MAG: acyl-CoA dehydrogenase family protein [Desulfobaccales bacterium]
MAWDFGISKEEEGYRKKVAAFLDQELTEEIARQNWEDLGLGEEGRIFGRKLYDSGLLGWSWPREYGGKGLSPIYDFILIDELGKRWSAHIPNDVAYTMVGHTILRRGSEEMKRIFIPLIIRGEIEFSLGYTEPEAGSDLANMKMTAIEAGDFFVINGQKTFNTESHYADYHWLAAKTDLKTLPHQGISLFIVDQRAPGITIRPLITMSGERTNEVFYDDVKVPKDRLVGDKNKGFYYMMEALGSERNYVFVPSRYLPYLHMMIEYVKNTEYNGKRLSEDPSVRQKIAQIAVEIEVATLLADHSRWMEWNNMTLTCEPEITKVVVSEMEQRMVDSAMQILDLYSQLEEGSKHVPLKGRIEWEYLHSFMTTIGAGTSEIGRNVIAQRGLGLPRS